MPTNPSRTRLATLAAAAWLAAGGAAAGDAGVSDPCSFFRAHAYGRGLTHFATEMLWACEAIRARREAEMEVGERLLAVEQALERYRAAVIAAGVAARGGRSWTGGDATRTALAETTGMLAALEAIRFGF